jgi:hypothetical protein
MEGWILIHRKIMDNWIWQNPLYLKAWMAILLTVNTKDKETIIEGEILKCNRGQALISLAGWVKIFGKKWTIQKARTFLNLLKNEKMVELEGLRKTTRLTVCNYEDYQKPQQGDNKEITTTKIKKKGKEVSTLPKREATKLPDFIDEIVNMFIEVHGNYVIVARGKERSAAGKILQLYKTKYPDATAGEVLNGLRAFFTECVSIDDEWLRNNMSLPIIVSQFNKIRNLLINGKTNNKKGATTYEIAKTVAKYFATDDADIDE